jgi:hypothetical protein
LHLAEQEVGPVVEMSYMLDVTALGTPLNPNKVLERFETVLKKAGLPHIRFHDVRRFGDCKIALKGQKVRAITF